MKKALSALMLILVFSNCAAPELSLQAKQWQADEAISQMQRAAYQKELNRFIEDLRAKESPDWKAVNSIGCMGWFQFTHATLTRLGYGYITPELFLKTPEVFPGELQITVLEALIRSNELLLAEYKGYIGKIVCGVYITNSGLLAGSHLGGAGAVILFLQTNGMVNAGDINGTTIRDYIRQFQGYKI